MRDLRLRDVLRDQKFRSYFKTRMGESLLTGVPEIVNASSWLRRLVKSIVFVSCVIGFIYQAHSFLVIFLEYPTVQDFKVDYPEKLRSPAVTFCNGNRINRERFCEGFPDKCTWYEAPANFCTAAPLLCPENWSEMKAENFVLGIPDLENYKDDNQTTAFLDAYGPQNPLESFHKPFHLNCKAGTYECKESDIIVFQAANGGLPYKCFTIFSLFEKPYQIPNTLRLTDRIFFSLNAHPEQLMDPKDIVQFHVLVHDPRRLPNPLAEGTSLSGGQSYMFFMTVEERTSLPPPYKTNCIDYITKWEENGGIGPVIKKDCTELCKINKMMQLYGCIGKSITSPTYLPLCPTKNITLSLEMNQECSSGCREACDTTVYTLLTQTSEYIGAQECADDSNPHCKNRDVRLSINFERLTMQKFTTDPKFEDIELFSYIDGYMGMWLGISLVAFIDFLEAVMDIVVFASRRWKSMKETGEKGLQY